MKCIQCNKYILGQRWKYCSNKCNSYHNSFSKRKRKRVLELKEIKQQIIYKRIKLNSSKAAFDLIKTLTK